MTTISEGPMHEAEAPPQTETGPPAPLPVHAASHPDYLSVITDATKKRDPDLDWSVFRIGLQLTRLSNLHFQRSDRDVRREHGLTWSGFHVMFIVWHYGPLEANEIARLSGVTRQSVSSGLATLERLGLIHRERSTVDRRRVNVSLTAQGRQRVRDALRTQNANEVLWYQGLDAAEREQLVALMTKATESLRAHRHD
ncbi:MAG: MarR family transcriptional regulator [Dermatophilus congolensis]|nr:MarR family transcriptional regulator [Dermatophilus congolensis]